MSDASADLSNIDTYNSEVNAIATGRNVDLITLSFLDLGGTPPRGVFNVDELSFIHNEQILPLGEPPDSYNQAYQALLAAPAAILSFRRSLILTVNAQGLVMQPPRYSEESVELGPNQISIQANMIGRNVGSPGPTARAKLEVKHDS